VLSNLPVNSRQSVYYQWFSNGLLQLAVYSCDFPLKSDYVFILLFLVVCLITAVDVNCLQQKLMELNQWSERMHSCEPTFITNNGLFAVTCSYFHHSIIPELDYIRQQTYEFVAVQTVADAQQFRSELQQFIQVQY